MKFFRSIRWRLQLWYGVLLLAVLSGFGITAYRLETSRQMRQIDEELQRRLPVLVKSQHPVPGNRERRELTVSAKDAAIFDREADGQFYYVVWLRHGEPVTRSASAPLDVPQPRPGDPPNRLRGTMRESFLFPGPGDCVLVGREIAHDLAGLRQLAGWLAGVGAAVLLLGVTGGAWLVTRALRPIRDISNAAGKISTGDLTQRISPGNSDSELGQLVGVLNSTFARLDAAFTQQARFTADAAHELRTPLAVILTHTQNGLSSKCLNEEHHEAFAASQRAVQRMRRLIESLLTLARLDAGQPPAYALCNLGRTVHDSIDLLRPLAKEREISIDADLPSVPCRCDAEQIAQVVTNLVSNAISYNQPGGSVNVNIGVESGAIFLAVRDTGHGIESEDLPHVFERFYRADKARSGAAGRTGLGLAITKAIVDGHGGTIEVATQAGRGSVFTVRLPDEGRPG